MDDRDFTDIGKAVYYGFATGGLGAIGYGVYQVITHIF
jgi:hypothetical protein